MLPLQVAASSAAAVPPKLHQLPCVGPLGKKPAQQLLQLLLLEPTAQLHCYYCSSFMSVRPYAVWLDSSWTVSSNPCCPPKLRLLLLATWHTTVVSNDTPSAAAVSVNLAVTAATLHPGSTIQQRCCCWWWCLLHLVLAISTTQLDLHAQDRVCCAAAVLLELDVMSASCLLVLHECS